MFKDFFTDVKGRWEIKNFIGLFVCLAAVILSIIWLFSKNNVAESLAIFGGFFSAGLGCFVTSAVADAQIDKNN